jgi:uncharacterized protein YbjT (DUF2867 family)
LAEEGHLSGPEALSDADIANILSLATGKAIKYVDVPAQAARTSLKAC